MSLSMCFKHQVIDEPESPCLACVIEGIYEVATSRDGSPETDEKNLKQIAETCSTTLKLIDSAVAELAAEGDLEGCFADCDECGNPIPASCSSEVNDHHKESCSLHPKAVT